MTLLNRFFSRQTRAQRQKAANQRAFLNSQALLRAESHTTPLPDDAPYIDVHGILHPNNVVHIETEDE